ncbi:hypothetical protein MJL22_27765, partial [Salmonella enterica subsp. enterica serovar Montevideo]|nr:hypothetical protein [Salmonella enterica subsp. enterica serovar Montevideo]
ILDIFAQRARTHEGKLQVELAQLRHLATRLVRGWTHLERQKGVKALIDPMRSFSDATYITVGNEKGQRLYHVNPNEIGKYMEGG